MTKQKVRQEIEFAYYDGYPLRRILLDAEPSGVQCMSCGAFWPTQQKPKCCCCGGEHVVSARERRAVELLRVYPYPYCDTEEWEKHRRAFLAESDAEKE